jgi:biopolymer transport protein ExbD
MAIAERSAAARETDAKVPVDMTPMIDIVFQLMIFFLLTLKIIEAEGDFHVRMPRRDFGPPLPTALPPLKLRMVATANGGLGSMHLNGRPLADFSQLRQEVSQLVHTVANSPETSEVEVEIDSDPPLHYRHVIAAITAVSGERTADGAVVPLVKKINFAPPR